MAILRVWEGISCPSLKINVSQVLKSSERYSFQLLRSTQVRFRRSSTGYLERQISCFWAVVSLDIVRQVSETQYVVAIWKLLVDCRSNPFFKIGNEYMGWTILIINSPFIKASLMQKDGQEPHPPLLRFFMDDGKLEHDDLAVGVDSAGKEKRHSLSSAGECTVGDSWLKEVLKSAWAGPWSNGDDSKSAGG